MPFAIYILSFAALALGTSEFVPNGLLPQTSADLDVSVAAAGWLTTTFALGVVVGGPVIVAATMRVPRKTLVTGILLVFTLASAISALGPNLPVVAIGRAISGAMLGGFLGAATLVSVKLVPQNRQAGAIALVFTGFTISNVIGVPIGTLVGQVSSWRAAYWLVVVLGLLSVLAVATAMPALSSDAPTRLRDDLRAFRRPVIWLGLGASALGYGGLFVSYTYITPMLTDLTGLPGSSITWVLLLFGVGLIVGNRLGGWFADRDIVATSATLMVILIVALVALGVLGHLTIPTLALLVILGGAGFGLVPPLQTYVIQLTGGASAMVASANPSAFSLGIAIGSWLGGLTLDAGLGQRAPSFVGAVMTLAGLALFAVVVRLAARERRTDTPVVTTRPVPVARESVS